MKVIVVGVGGVGMAHICAASRCDLEIAAIVDTDAKILDNAKIVWVNKWLDVFETAPKQGDTIYAPAIECLGSDIVGPDDLIILATPPDSHIFLVKYCLKHFKARILVEKPISIHQKTFPEHMTKRLILSTEWIYHSRSVPDPIHTLSMRFPKASTTNWGYHLPAALDFGPHLISILLHNGYKLKDIVHYSSYISDSDGRDRFWMEVGIKGRGDVSILGSRFDDGPIGLEINHLMFDWEEDLFDKQLNNIKEGSKGVSWTEMERMENQVKQYLS